MIKKTCIYCGAEFEAKRSDAKFCSAKCRMANKREHQKTPKICPICGTEFIPNKQHINYCSDECSKIARDKKIKQYNAKWNPIYNPIYNPINNPKNNYKYTQRAKQSANAARQNNPDITVTINSKRELEYVYGTTECENELYKIESKKPTKTKKSKFADLL